VSKPIRYRPMSKDKDAQMVVDESGEWTSLTCYYLLHDEVERLQGQVEHYIAALGKQEVLNQHLVKAGNYMASRIKFDSNMEDEDWGVSPKTPECVKAWLAAKGGQS